MTSTRTARTAAADKPVALSLLEDLFGPSSERPFALQLWDGTVEIPDREPGFTLVLNRPGSLRRMLFPPTDLALGEAYLRDDFDVEGDLEQATGLADVLGARLRSPVLLARLWRELPTDDFVQNGAEGPPGRPRGRPHSRGRNSAAVRSHYDVGNEFYALWLDGRMAYSCAYFETGEEDIHAAQEAKLDLVCRKLRLEDGETLLDIGCGWGSLVLHAVERYGVRATGITLSERQATFARRRIAEAGLADRCRIEVRDYRDLPGEAVFDKVVSVGMFEHAGRTSLPTYFSQAYRLTRPGGLFLNHGIVSLSSRPAPLRMLAGPLAHKTSFIQRYVFPDGELVPPADVLRLAEAAGFETRDLESLREHYALTLRRWVKRLEDHHEEATRIAGETTYRIWRLYMSGSARAFATGRIGVIQTLLSKNDEDGHSRLPLTRKDIYRPSAVSDQLDQKAES
jgi:cyclopropane-fatty-acyl-phospholipid synthase